MSKVKCSTRRNKYLVMSAKSNKAPLRSNSSSWNSRISVDEPKISATSIWNRRNIVATYISNARYGRYKTRENTCLSYVSYNGLVYTPGEKRCRARISKKSPNIAVALVSNSNAKVPESMGKRAKLSKRSILATPRWTKSPKRV